jgi:hypothetical protein
MSTTSSSTSSTQSKWDTKLFRTKFCRSFTTGEPCTHTKCCYAHTVEERNIPKCRHGNDCRFIEFDEYEHDRVIDSRYVTEPCMFIHPTEKNDDYYNRVGWPKMAAKLYPKTPATPVKPKSKQKFTPSAPIKKKLKKPVFTTEPVLVKPVDDEIVIRVPKDMVLMVLQTALNLGKTNIRIETI